MASSVGRVFFKQTRILLVFVSLQTSRVAGRNKRDIDYLPSARLLPSAYAFFLCLFPLPSAYSYILFLYTLTTKNFGVKNLRVFILGVIFWAGVGKTPDNTVLKELFTRHNTFSCKN